MIGREGLRPHDLRHSAATAWIRGTVDVKAVQALPGHSTATMTLDLHSHLLTDSLDRATDLMAKTLVDEARAAKKGRKNARKRKPEREGS